MDDFESFRSRQDADRATARAGEARAHAGATKARVIELVARSHSSEDRTRRALSESAATLARTRDRLTR